MQEQISRAREATRAFLGSWRSGDPLPDDHIPCSSGDESCGEQNKVFVPRQEQPRPSSSNTTTSFRDWSCCSLRCCLTVGVVVGLLVSIAFNIVLFVDFLRRPSTRALPEHYPSDSSGTGIHLHPHWAVAGVPSTASCRLVWKNPYYGACVSSTLRGPLYVLERLDTKNLQVVVNGSGAGDEDVVEGGGDSSSTASGPRTSAGDETSSIAWKLSPHLPDSWQASDRLFAGTGRTANNPAGHGYHKGHMACGANHRSSSAAYAATFDATNRWPQNGEMNSYFWAYFERFVRELVAGGYRGTKNGPRGAPRAPQFLNPFADGEVFVATGGVFLPTDTSAVLGIGASSTTPVAGRSRPRNDKQIALTFDALAAPRPAAEFSKSDFQFRAFQPVWVPSHLYKVVAAVNGEGTVFLASFLVPNEKPVDNQQSLTDFLVPLKLIEDAVGVDPLLGFWPAIFDSPAKRKAVRELSEQGAGRMLSEADVASNATAWGGAFLKARKTNAKTPWGLKEVEGRKMGHLCQRVLCRVVPGKWGL